LSHAACLIKGEGIASRVDSRQILGCLASNLSQLSRRPEFRRTESQFDLEIELIDQAPSYFGPTIRGGPDQEDRHLDKLDDLRVLAGKV
jgi:hypothetical protein